MYTQHVLRRTRIGTQLTRILTQTQARRHLSLRDIQLQRRKLQQQKEEQQQQQQRQQAQGQGQSGQQYVQSQGAGQHFPVQGFNAETANIGAVSIPKLDVVQSGSTSDFKWSIQGHQDQIVEIDILPGRQVVAETGAMLEMSAGVNMTAKARGGFMQNFRRTATEQGSFLTEFTYSQSSGHGRTVFTSPYPSKILALDLATLGGALICQKNAFLVGSNTVGIEVAYTNNFSSGGEGFILQQLHGHGLAFVRAGGAVIKRVLKPGETIRVSTGSIVAFQPSVEYDVQMIPGFKNALFGEEGIFLATLTGPGLVILQSLPFDRLVGAIANRAPSSHGGSSGLAHPVYGGVAAGRNQSSLEEQRRYNNQPAAAAPSGPGLGTTIAGTMAGAALGSIAGHAIMSGMGGGGHSGSTGDAGAAATGGAAGAAGTTDAGAEQPVYDDAPADNGWGNDDGGDGGDSGWGDDGGD